MNNTIKKSFLDGADAITIEAHGKADNESRNIFTVFSNWVDQHRKILASILIAASLAGTITPSVMSMTSESNRITESISLSTKVKTLKPILMKDQAGLIKTKHSEDPNKEIDAINSAYATVTYNAKIITDAISNNTNSCLITLSRNGESLKNILSMIDNYNHQADLRATKLSPFSRINSNNSIIGQTQLQAAGEQNEAIKQRLANHEGISNSIICSLSKDLNNNPNSNIRSTYNELLVKASQIAKITTPSGLSNTKELSKYIESDVQNQFKEGFGLTQSILIQARELLRTVNSTDDLNAAKTDFLLSTALIHEEMIINNPSLISTLENVTNYVIKNGFEGNHQSYISKMDQAGNVESVAINSIKENLSEIAKGLGTYRRFVFNESTKEFQTAFIEADHLVSLEKNEIKSFLITSNLKSAKDAYSSGDIVNGDKFIELLKSSIGSSSIKIMDNLKMAGQSLASARNFVYVPTTYTSNFNLESKEQASLLKSVIITANDFTWKSRILDYKDHLNSLMNSITSTIRDSAISSIIFKLKSGSDTDAKQIRSYESMT